MNGRKVKTTKQYRRRANGDGTTFQRPNGSWTAQALVTLANGGKKRITVTEKSYAAVREKLREIINQESCLIPFSDKEWTISEYLDFWMQNVQQGRVRETTMSTYRYMIEKHIKPTIGGHKLQDLSVYNVQNSLKAIEKSGCSGAVQQKCLQILSACLNYAMHERGGQLVNRNVAQLVEKPNYTPKKTVIWTEKQAALFLETIKDHPQYIAFLILLNYGLRRGEVLGLRWSDIDIENKWIHVRQQISRVNGEIKARDLKTENNPYFELSTKGTIVVSEAGTPLEPRNLARLFHNLTKKVGLPRIKLHATRHITATLLKNENMPDKDMQLFFGHARITTTQNIYQHGTPEIQGSAVSSVGMRLLGKI
jgi:integrase